MPHSKTPPCALTIAGSDSGGGAGIQADLKTFAAFGCHGLVAISALTAQNTQRVGSIHLPPSRFLSDQLDAVLEDYPVRAVKIGMLGDAGNIATVAAWLRRLNDVPVVLDPVMIASSGGRLLDSGALGIFRQELLPLATLLTPNLPEAAMLLGHELTATGDLADAVRELGALGAQAVLLKGGHGDGSTVEDWLQTPRGLLAFRHPRLAREGHGTGCTLASALAAALAQGCSMERAAEIATNYVHAALRASIQPGRGSLHVLAHFAPEALAIASEALKGESPCPTGLNPITETLP